MPVTNDLVSTWRAPRATVRRHLDRGRSEPFAFTLLFVFLILTFVGQWPIAAREAYLAGDGAVAPRILARAFAVLATVPLWYGLAALSHLVARAMGGQGSWYGARIALFWALASIGPLMLLQGLIGGMIGPGTQLWAVTTLVGLAFLALWLIMLHEVERG
jgi:hypothetical protein